MAQHRKSPWEDAALPVEVVRNKLSAHQHPKFTGKLKEPPCLPSSSHHTHMPQNSVCFQSPFGVAAKSCFSNPIHAVATTLTHIWVCKLLGQRTPMRRRPNMRVRAAGSWQLPQGCTLSPVGARSSERNESSSRHQHRCCSYPDLSGHCLPEDMQRHLQSQLSSPPSTPSRFTDGTHPWRRPAPGTLPSSPPHHTIPTSGGPEPTEISLHFGIRIFHPPSVSQGQGKLVA